MVVQILASRFAAAGLGVFPCDVFSTPAGETLRPCSSKVADDFVTGNLQRAFCKNYDKLFLHRYLQVLLCCPTLIRFGHVCWIRNSDTIENTLAFSFVTFTFLLEMCYKYYM